MEELFFFFLFEVSVERMACYSTRTNSPLDEEFFNDFSWGFGFIPSRSKIAHAGVGLVFFL